MINNQDTRYKQNSKLKIQKSKLIVRLSLIVIVWLFFLAAWSLPVCALSDPEAKISKVIEDYVIAKYPDWAVLDIIVTFKYADKTFDKMRELEENAAFKVVEAYQSFKPVGNVIFPIEITAGGETKKVFIRAKVEVFENIVIAKKNIKRGQIIEEDDLAVEQRDIAMLPQKYFKDIGKVTFTEAKTTIPKNSTVFEWMVKEIPAVHRGQELTIYVKGENLLVKTTGIALEDGYIGQEIKIKRKDAPKPENGYQKPPEGILISSTEVEVILK